jgi:arylsulfatase A-like enzyme
MNELTRPARVEATRKPLDRRLVRVGTESEAAGGPTYRPGFAGTLAIALWCGLALGLLEVGLLLARGRMEGPASSGVLHLNRQYLWMIPTANAAIFLAAGLVCAMVGLAVPRSRVGGRPLWFVMFSLAALALLWPIKAIHELASVALGMGIGARLSRPAARHGRGIARAMCGSLPVGLALVGGRFAWDQDRARHGEARELAGLAAATAGAENVILIVLDTVRADHMSLYGYERETTPNLKRVAAERGIVFDFARSPAPWTLPSHATLFTGRWPHEVDVSQQRPYDGRYPTLAERLRGAGYATGGFVSNMYYLNHWYGLDRGFVHFEDHPEHHGITPRELLRNTELGRRVLAWSGLRPNTRAGDFGIRKQADDVNRHLLTWLDGGTAGRKGRPFFAFLNYLDAHDPYVVPPGKVAPFGLAGDPAHADTLRRWHLMPKDKVSPEARQLMIDGYDSCLAYVDAAVGELLEELSRRGLDETTWVVITSDHGEHLGEHELYLHGQSLYRPLIDVPLVVLPPRSRGIAPGRVARAVSTREVPRTIAELLNLEDGGGFPGRSLARFWEGSEASGEATEEPVLSEADLGIRPKPGKRVKARAPVARGPMEALAMDGHTYMRLGDGSEQLYDLAADPGEERDRSKEPAEARRIEAFRAELREMMGR